VAEPERLPRPTTRDSLAGQRFRGEPMTPLFLLALAQSPAAQAAEAGVALERASLAAAGRQATVLRVARFGRVAIVARSGQGASLEVVDRMAGSLGSDGAAGERDGRLDLFLERGEYRVVTASHAMASGSVALEARAFEERNAATPPRLVELKPLAASLGDFEQLSYWLEVAEARTVALEAAGRCLSELRLWRDGQWLVDAAPELQLVQPRSGRPLRLLRLATRLDPGLYLLTAYGGPPQPWAEDDGSHPFHLRFGIPRLPEAGRRRFAVSPFGVDRYRVPGGATYFRLELPEARPATLRVGWFEPDAPFAEDGVATEITKESLPPIAETMQDGDPEREHVVTVGGAEADAYLLQHFEARREYPFTASGDYWLSTIHSGAPEDSLDATAVVTLSSKARRVEPFLAQAVELDTRTGWGRRANLLAPASLFLHVKEAGAYEVLAKGVEARFRIEPFFVFRPEGYKAPPARGSGSRWDLDAGYWVLTAEPVRKGIVDLVVRPAGLVGLALDALGLGKDTAEAGPARGGVRFPRVALDRERSYCLYLNQQPDVEAGVILRPLPLDLSDALFVSQRPGEELSVPFTLRDAGTLRAEAEDGNLLEVAVDGGAWQTSVEVGPGTHTAAVRNSGPGTRQYSLLVEPALLDPKTPLPALPDAALASLPDLPALAEGPPRSLDLARRASASFLVRADRPGLYRLESTGLLATQGNLRTRTVTSLLRESANGVGRNFLLQPFLREGDYQLSVTTEGLSAGRLGVSLQRARVRDGGFLTSGLPARATLAPGEAVAYRFVITKPGEFRIRALGLSRTFRCRLEDRDGWPLATPGVEADLTRDFPPGRYRLVILPEATEARVVTAIEPVRRPVQRTGHGPHRLALARRVVHAWLEPEAGGERTPDAWLFTLPAPAEVRIELTGEMQGRLLRLEGPDAVEAASIPPLGGFKGPLAAGRYRLEAVCSRQNNRAPYQVGVWPEPLVAGLDRELAAPAEVPVAVGETGLVVLASFGTSDVRARLYDEAGRLVAANDDRPDDWNFEIARSLSAGRYRLRVDPVGSAAARTSVSMRVPREDAKPALALPASRELRLGRTVQAYPLSLPQGSELLIASATARESVALALEVRVGEAWRTLGTASGRAARLEAVLPAEAAAARLRAWSVDRRDASARLTVAALTPPPAREQALASGLALEPVPGISPPVAALAVELERPGLLRLEDASVRWSARPGSVLADAGAIVPVTGRRLWLVRDAASRPAEKLRAARVVIAASATRFPLSPDAPATLDVGPSDGPVLVTASSQAGQPGVALGPASDEARPGGGPLAVAEGSAVAVALRASGQAALVWSAAPGAPDGEVRVEAAAFEPPRVERVALGSWEGVVEGRKARAFALPKGRKRLRLALDAGLVAVLSQGDVVASVHWAAAAAAAETLESDADRLTLMAPREGGGRFAALAFAVPEGDALPPVAPGSPFEAGQDRAGVLRLAVAAAERATLHVRGAGGAATYVAADGRVERGTDLRVGPGGTLVVPHVPGLLLCWADEPGTPGPDVATRSAPVEVRLPSAVRLSGPERALKVAPREPVVLHLRSATPMVTLLRRDGGAPRVDVHAQGVALDAYLPGGAAELVLRGLADAPLHGVAELTSTPVTPIDEGLGPEVLLAPGATRVFSFSVESERAVGIGVRAGADVVDATLRDAAGVTLGSGVVQMPTLAPGTYLLALRAPEDAAPVRARPALAGLRLPDTGPPDAVVRGYLEPEQARPVFTATRVAMPEPRRPVPGEEPEAGFEPEAGLEGVEEGEAEEWAEEEPVEDPELVEDPEDQAEGGGR
jgi:hypothetical protein